MKLLIYSSVIFLLSACSSEQRYVCEEYGLILTKDKAIFSDNENLEFCNKTGTVNLYSTNCKVYEVSGLGKTLSFDTVAKTVRMNTFNGSLQCKKL
jgi:hypothetical protein